MSLMIRQADLSQPADLVDVVQMIDDYTVHALGDSARLSEDAKAKLSAGLRDTPGAVAFLAFNGDQPVGVAMSFTGYSTFAMAPVLNVHDFAVVSAMRRRGVGRKLMQAVIDYAESHGYAKVTLEVRPDNAGAKALYAEAGFASTYEFWARTCGKPPA